MAKKRLDQAGEVINDHGSLKYNDNWQRRNRLLVAFEKFSDGSLAVDGHD